MASSSNNNAKSPTEKYPYPTEFNVLDFVPKLLGQTNYEKWKKLMRDFIKRRGLIGFIYGTAKEEIGNQDDYKACERSSNLVQGWILATLTEDIRLQLRKSITAKDLWEELSRKFDPASPFWRFDEERENRVRRYVPLLKATIKGDWEEARGIIEHDPDAVRTPIADFDEVALTVAVRSKGRNHFVRKLLEKMTPQDVVNLVDDRGWTALHFAAAGGNIEGARMLVNKNSVLPNVVDGDGLTPLDYGASWGHREMVLYLLEVTSEELATDIALSLLQRKPELACVEPNPLGTIVEKYSSFKSRNSFNFWQNLIYLGLPKKSRSIANHHNGGDIENPPKCCISVSQRLHFMFWRVAENLVPCIKLIREIKEKQHHALELVEILCMEIAKSKPSEVRKIFKPVLRRAIYYGIPEIVEEIIVSYPEAMAMKVQDDLIIFQYAIQCRREGVFNLIYQLDYGSIVVARRDKSRNNGLHLAASLKHEQQIIVRASVAGPVLQMQRELQWFEEVEKFAAPGAKEARNTDGMTPAEVFSETHQNLVKDGEKWMKDTATSCTIVAALIATMVFAAAITVPGGNNSNNGHPVLSKQKAFVSFGISDALALFSSITSVLMFLLILTSRYAEEDFLHTLPDRLVIGLITLFVSILSTMVAFGAILYLVFGDNQEWVLIPIIALASIPATLFGALQLPLLVEMIQSTYGRSIFGKQGDRVLG
ncbi:hypothetical protein Vadar_007237 [Vaccinium darrowii]|uniref:Uncharacterized protein n=1 Tax=Vaccinium darrowii TaxID=229202 RepID=A0ACB7YL10_9ERIC|nr:hypothetical protein Vadar_007237 [Vaccinium darrowii]